MPLRQYNHQIQMNHHQILLLHRSNKLKRQQVSKQHKPHHREEVQLFHHSAERKLVPNQSHSDSRSESSTIGTMDDKENHGNTVIKQRSVLVSDDKKEVIETYIHTPRSNASNFSQTGNSFTSSCSCSTSAFSGREEHMEFFLPKLGMACNCNKPSEDCLHCVYNQDPAELKSILRTWQVDFLASLSIHRAEQLIVAYKRNPRRMARAMKQWRIDNEMQPVRSKSCYVALHIWCRTSKVVLKSIKQQKLDRNARYGRGAESQPGGLEISFSSDYSVSTLGLGSELDAGVLGETMEI
mmetsp:Transcript_22346/g.32899  ORF Transcript_22346/g.32899 Transcript_22346/m.32899 type:complete len:296 (+) Transcript_22346:339-1226(+)